MSSGCRKLSTFANHHWMIFFHVNTMHNFICMLCKLHFYLTHRRVLHANICLIKYQTPHTLTCRTCLNCSSKLHPLFCCDELDVSLDVDEFEPKRCKKRSINHSINCKLNSKWFSIYRLYSLLVSARWRGNYSASHYYFVMMCFVGFVLRWILNYFVMCL